MQRWHFLAVLFLFLLPFVFGEDEESPRLDSDISVVQAQSPDEVIAEVKRQNKPGLVIVTQSWCPKCKALVRSINGDAEIKKLMDQFVVAHVSGTPGKAWQVEGRHDGYIPRVFFLDAAGRVFEEHGPNTKYPFFFPRAKELCEAGQDVLDKSQPLPQRFLAASGLKRVKRKLQSAARRLRKAVLGADMVV